MNIASLFKKISHPTAWAFLLILGTATAGQAAQVAIFKHNFGGGASNTLQGDGIAVSLDRWTGCCQSYFPLQTPFWSPDDVGSTFTFTAATDSNFNNFVALITNGVNDSILPRDIRPGIGSGGTVRSESQLFGSVAGGNGIDLQGFSIQSITATLDSLTITTPGSLGGTSWNGSVTWGFNDDIPDNEPPTESVPEPLTILGSATAVFFGAFFKHQHSQKLNKKSSL